ncbi:phosphopantetheine-binding protein [Streptomyces sp. NPDC048419]|uniref:phosphopantetheine-binding protein n=1 Tax=Streptomyces sp. NPDC048419 TaxID=3365547 RepID=UPI003715F0D3
MERWARAGKLSKLAAVWVKGLEVDWNLLHEGSARRRIALPTYPFARTRYWIGDLTPVAATTEGTGRDVTTEALAPSSAEGAHTRVHDAEEVPSVSVALDVEVPRIVRAVLAEALAMPETDIIGTSAFADYGLDSILAVRVAHELSKALSLDSTRMSCSTTARPSAWLTTC